MKAESVIYARLTSFVGITDLVGGTGSTARIYGISLPQEPVYPAITYRLINSERIESVHSDPGYAKARIQVTCWDATYQGVKALAEQVRLALERYGSAVTGTVIAGVTVYDIHMGSQADVFEPELRAYAVATDFNVLHAE